MRRGDTYAVCHDGGTGEQWLLAWSFSHGGNFLPVCETGHTLLLSCSAEPATRRGDSLPRRWMLKVHAPYRSGKDGGQLVALGFEVAPFTPAPYQRPSLERPSKEI